MADLVLYSQILEPEDDGRERVESTCLLVYDGPYFSDERLSNDVREQLESHPTLARIYVAAPLVSHVDLIEAIRDGSAMLRGAGWGTEEGTLLRAITLERVLTEGPFQLLEHFGWPIDSGIATHSRKQNLPDVLIHGWLFDLFARHQGMVLAPPGVHFGKTSGKHSDRFLRAANLLFNSAICRLIAYFSLPQIKVQKYRQIYVDTSPLISVGSALLEVSKAVGISLGDGGIQSFASYAGVKGQAEYRDTDLLLISASTSGGLVTGLLQRGAVETNVLTLFYLQAKGWNKTRGRVLCDLTHDRTRLFGYSEVLSYAHEKCPLCESGHMLAEFEGDQFLLQRRRTKRLKVTKASQANGARQFFETVARNQLISVSLVGPSRSKYSDVRFDVERMMNAIDEVRAEVTFKLRRSLPSPLDFIVSDEVTSAELSTWTMQNGKLTIQPTAPCIVPTQLDKTTPQFEAAVLVFFGALQNDFQARSINRALRRVAPRGSITYFATVLVCESPEARRDLITFLEYGERGPKTFVVEPVFEILISQRSERSPWDLERDFLAGIVSSSQSLPKLQARSNYLAQTTNGVNGIFLEGQKGPLAINDDFVYLSTKDRKAEISQADIYAVVSNLLAACRNDNREISKPVTRGSEPLVWSSTIYGQILLCPTNFKDYNDGVLHAALLRAAASEELRYDTDEGLSGEMLAVMLDELLAWKRDEGQALAEFCLSMATGRLVLKPTHAEEFARAVAAAGFVPNWVKALV